VSLSLLSPLVLGLAVLIAGPIIAHMARRRPIEERPFGAMMLLNRVVSQIRKERRIQDKSLFLLRLLAVIMIVMAATRPEVTWSGQASGAGSTGRVVVIFDNSMSMSQTESGVTMLERARESALRFVESLPMGAEIALITIGGTAESRFIIDDGLSTTDRSAVTAELEAISMGYGGTDLHGGLRLARTALASEPGEVTLFSDQAGPAVLGRASSQLQALLETGVSVQPFTFSPRNPSNVWVTDASYGEGLEGGAITVNVASVGAENLEMLCTVYLPDGSEISAFLDLDEEGRASEQFTVPPEVPGGVGRVEISDPNLTMDNTRYFHVPRVGASKVMVVDGDPGDTPIASEVYFLERALAPWGMSAGGVLPEVVTINGLSALNDQDWRVVFLANVSDLGNMAPKLLEFVRGGGGVVISGGDLVSGSQYNSPLHGLLPAPIRRPRDLVALGEGEGAALSLPDVDEPIFSLFTAGGRAALSQISARRAITFEPYAESSEVRTLAEWEGGIPALIERKIGNGSVLFWTSTFDLGWGNAPVQAAFMPLVQSLVSYLGGVNATGAERIEGVVDREVSVTYGRDFSQSLVLTGPQGDPVTFQESPGERDKIVFSPETPGTYSIGVAGSPAEVWVAVNVSAEESDISPGQLIEQVSAEIAPELFLKRASLAWSLLLLGVCMFLLQGFMGWLWSKEAV
jgi:hypothetical protein